MICYLEVVKDSMKNIRPFCRLRVLIVIIFLLFTGLSVHADKEKPTITVLPFQSVEVPESVSVVISTLFETNLVNTGAYTVLSQGERDRILKAQEAFTADFADEVQAIRIGELLSAKQIILGTVAILGSKYIINAKIIDVSTSETLAAGSVNASSLDDLDIACLELTTTLVTGTPASIAVSGVRAETTVFDEDQLNFITFSNQTSTNIELLFVSPSDSDHWGPEILGSERIFSSGDVLGFYLHYPDNCSLFDIMAIDSSGYSIYLYEYEICDGREERIEFTDEDLTDEISEMSFVPIDIGNDAAPIYYLFISPSDSNMWGADYLGEEDVIGAGDTLSLLFPAGSDGVDYDLMAVDEDGDIYKFSFNIDEDSDGLTFPIEFSDMQ